jgi:hypothetical protein
VPSAPKTAAKAAAKVHFATWDEFVTEATKGIEPYVQPVPPTADDPHPDPVEVPCPTGDQLVALGAAQTGGSDEAAFVAIFGEELAPRLLLATGSLPFTVRAQMIQKLMMHYGMQSVKGMPGVPDPE